MVRSAHDKSATYEDVLAAPENMVAELIGGELFLQPRPAKRYTRVATTLSVELGRLFDRGLGGPGGWWILAEPEIHFGRDVLVPDLAGWRRASTPTFDYDVAYYQERPDWVCEVLSPSTARKDRVLKLDVYYRAEVEWAWTVDPHAETIEVFRWGQEGWIRKASADGREVVHLDPFAEADLDLDAIWPPEPSAAP